jgi:hypothetical protein
MIGYNRQSGHLTIRSHNCISALPENLRISWLARPQKARESADLDKRITTLEPLKDSGPYSPNQVD